MVYIKRYNFVINITILLIIFILLFANVDCYAKAANGTSNMVNYLSNNNKEASTKQFVYANNDATVSSNYVYVPLYKGMYEADDING